MFLSTTPTEDKLYDDPVLEDVLRFIAEQVKTEDYENLEGLEDVMSRQLGFVDSSS